MPPLTWQTVAAPNLGRAADIMNQAALSFTAAGKGLGDGIRGVEDARDAEASARGMQLLAGISDPNEVNAVLGQVAQAVPLNRQTPALQEAMLSARDGISVTYGRNRLTGRADETHRLDMNRAEESGRIAAVMAGALGDADRQSNSDLTGGFDAYRDRIRAGESRNGQDVLFGDAENRFNFDPSTATAADWVNFQQSGGEYGNYVAGQNNGTFSTPLGDYQIVGSTFKEFFPKLGLPMDTVMTPEIQERVAREIFKAQGPGAWEALKHDGGAGYVPDARVEDILANSRYQTPENVSAYMTAGRGEYANSRDAYIENEGIFQGRAAAARNQELMDLATGLADTEMRGGTAVSQEDLAKSVIGQMGPLSVAERAGVQEFLGQYASATPGLNQPVEGFSLSPEQTLAGEGIAAGARQVEDNATFDAQAVDLISGVGSTEDVASAGAKLAENLGKAVEDPEGTYTDWGDSENDLYKMAESVVERLKEDTGGGSKVTVEQVLGMAQIAKEAKWFDSTGVSEDRLYEAAEIYGNREKYQNLKAADREQVARTEAAQLIESRYSEITQELGVLSGRDQSSEAVQERQQKLNAEIITLKGDMTRLIEQDNTANQSPEDQLKAEDADRAKQAADLAQAARQREIGRSVVGAQVLETAGNAGRSRRDARPATTAPAINRAADLLTAAVPSDARPAAAAPVAQEVRPEIQPFVERDGSVNGKLFTDNLLTVANEMQNLIEANPEFGDGAKIVLEMLNSDEFLAQLKADPTLAVEFFNNPESFGNRRFRDQVVRARNPAVSR